MHLLCDYAALLQYLGKTHSDARKLSPTRVAIFLKAEIEVRVFMGINLVWVQVFIDLLSTIHRHLLLDLCLSAYTAIYLDLSLSTPRPSCISDQSTLASLRGFQPYSTSTYLRLDLLWPHVHHLLNLPVHPPTRTDPYLTLQESLSTWISTYLDLALSATIYLGLWLPDLLCIILNSSCSASKGFPKPRYLQSTYF